MKKLLTYFCLMTFLTITALTFSSCKNSKYINNANNCFFADDGDLYFFKDGKFYEYELNDGVYETDSYDTLSKFKNIPKNINKNTIIYCDDYTVCTKEKNVINRYELEYEEDSNGKLIFPEEKYWIPFEIPEKNYKSIVIINSVYLMVQTNDHISFYYLNPTPEGRKWELSESVALDKEYDTSLLINCQNHEGFLGFFKGAELDIYYFDTWEKNSCVLKKRVDLKKEYDAYIGYMDEDDRLVLGCIEGNKIWLHDIAFGAIVSSRTF